MKEGLFWWELIKYINFTLRKENNSVIFRFVEYKNLDCLDAKSLKIYVIIDGSRQVRENGNYEQTKLIHIQLNIIKKSILRSRGEGKESVKDFNKLRHYFAVLQFYFIETVIN